MDREIGRQGARKAGREKAAKMAKNGVKWDSGVSRLMKVSSRWDGVR